VLPICIIFCALITDFSIIGKYIYPKIVLFSPCHFLISKNMFVLIRKAYERARLYTQRFTKIRENFEIDNSTDPTVLNTERGIRNMLHKK